MDEKLLITLANRTVKKLAGVIPSDQTLDDAKNDAVLFILERWNTGTRLESHLVMYATGRLRDKYAKLFEHNGRTRAESVRLASVRAGRRSDEPDKTLRGSYGRTALHAERVAAPDSNDARIDIESALIRLTALQRLAFTECVMLGRPHAEVASENNTTRYAISRHVARAKEKLRGLLHGYA